MQALLIITLFLALVASVSLWSGLELHAAWLLWLAVAAGLSSAVLAVITLRRREAAAQKGPLRWGRLALFALLVILGLAITGSLWLSHDRAMTLVHPRRILISRLPESAGIRAYQDVQFQASDGLTLRGWYMPTQNGAIVILLHGHGGNRTQFLPEAALLAGHGYGVLLYDARGSGESDGELSTYGLLEVNDLRGAVRFALDLPGVDSGRLGVAGFSMGGATVLMGAAQIPEISAVVAQSTFTSLEDNLSHGVERMTGLPPFPFAPMIVFFAQREAGMDIRQVRPEEAAAAISPRPLLIMHSALDDLAAVENAYQLYAAAREPKDLVIVEGAGHCCLMQRGGEAYKQKLLEFFEQLLAH